MLLVLVILLLSASSQDQHSWYFSLETRSFNLDHHLYLSFSDKKLFDLAVVCTCSGSFNSYVYSAGCFNDNCKLMLHKVGIGSLCHCKCEKVHSDIPFRMLCATKICLLMIEVLSRCYSIYPILLKPKNPGGLPISN